MQFIQCTENTDNKMEYPKSPFPSLVEYESQILLRNPSLQSEMLQWICQTPKITTYRINLLQTSLGSFKSRLQTLLSAKYSNPPKVYSLPHLPEILCIDPVQPSLLPPPELNATKEVIVDAACGAAVLRGAHIYAPGVLAMENGTKLKEKVLIYADMSGKCKKGANKRFESTEKIFLGVGIVRMQRHQLYAPPEKLCAGIAIEVLENISGVPSLGNCGLSCGEVLLQNLPSIVCVRVLDPQPNETILDMCASPGNKTTHIAEMMNDKGLIIALDKSEGKIEHIRRKISNNSLQSIRPFAFDSTKSFNEAALEVAMTPPFNVNTFDRILLDAPCSALGNRPVLKSKMTAKELKSFPRVQRKLFANAVPLLKPQGILVYSTCTITEEENECLLAWALQKFPNICLIDAVPKFGGPGLENVGLSEQQRHFVQRFGLSSTNADKDIDTVGFFIAKFMKIS